MKTIFILSLAALSVRAHAVLTVRGVSWPGDGVVKVLVASDGDEPTAIEVPLDGSNEATRTSGLFTATLRNYPASKAGERALLTILLSQQGGDLGSLYVLRENADGQFEYANKKPILGEAPSMKADLKNIFTGLRTYNGCTEIGALEALVTYKNLWPDREILRFKVEVENAAIDKGENGACAAPKGPKVAAPAAAPTTPVKPATPRATRRAPRPPNPYGGYQGGYDPRAGYGPYGGGGYAPYGGGGYGGYGY